MNAGEDIVLDLRENNGSVPKYENFWAVVAEYIEDKTAVSDRRHNSSDDEGDVVVYMAMTNSYADMYRLCVEIAKSKKRDIAIPTYACFCYSFDLQPRPHRTHFIIRAASKSNGWFRLVYYEKTTLIRITRTLYIHHADAVTFASVDAKCKCKISAGEPDFPITSVSRGKAVVIVGSNQTFKVGDHDFSKLSLIPDGAAE